MNSFCTRGPLRGAGFIAFAILFNTAFGWLAATFDYPNILRQPAGEILTRFAAGGPGLIVGWYLFALTAAAFLPVVWAVHSLTPATDPGRATARSLGTIAAVAQLFGLLRWTFVVPGLAAGYVDPVTTDATREAIAWQFTLLHQFAGVAIGEHLGQATTAFWLLIVAHGQAKANPMLRAASGVGKAAALLILIGLTEGLATVLPVDLGIVGLATPLGYVLLSLWLLVLGLSQLRSR